MECPECRLLNPPTAQRCDCGYDFQTQKMKASYIPGYLPPAVVRDLGRRDMRIGGIVFAGGLVVTIATYQMATERGGGYYLMAYGPIIWGAIQFLRGASRVRTGIDRSSADKR
jgi:hypothetical protein